MYQVIIMYGDNEPWWFFEEWEEDIIEEYLFDDFLTAKKCYNKYLQELSSKYESTREKDEYLTAFWNEGELRYCEDCEEDLQQYKGLLLLKNCKKISEAGKDTDETINYNGKAKCCKRSSKSLGSKSKK